MRSMRILAGLTLTVLMLGAGLACKDDKKPETAPSPRNPSAGDTSNYFGAMAAAKERAATEACAMNLNAIGKAIAIYQASHGDKSPASLDELVKLGMLVQLQLQCPDTPKPAYIYVTGLTAASPPESIIAYDPEPHDGKINIVRVNGMVETVPKDKFQKP